jgi:uncharacterized coiled-coil protein SlyX
MGSTESSTREGSTTGATVTGLLTLIDWTALPASTQQTIQTIGPLMQEGCSQKEIGRRLSLSDAAVSAMVAEMRQAIIGQAYMVVDRVEPPLRALVERLREAEQSRKAA